MNEAYMLAGFSMAGFASGSVMYACLIAMLYQVDLRAQSDDHNPGSSNVFKLCGRPAGITCLALDIGKGFVPVFLARTQFPLSEPFFALIIASPVLGHAFSPVLKMKGGKGIAVSYGVLLALMGESMAWLELALIMLVFSTALRIRPDAARVIASAFLLPIAVFLSGEPISVQLACLIISGVWILRHAGQFNRESVEVTVFTRR